MWRMSGSSTRRRSGPANAYGSGGGAGGEAQGTHGTGYPQDRLGTGVTRQEWMKVRAAAASRLRHGLMRDESICVSAKPLSHRMGSGTFSSMTEPSRVVVSSPVVANVQVDGAPARSEASAARRGGLIVYVGDAYGAVAGVECAGANVEARTLRSRR